MRTSLILLALSASATRAEVATWLWTVSDTGNGDGVIEPGESALLTLSVGFEPEATGFAAAGPYTISGDDAWSAGLVEEYKNLLDPEYVYGDGTLDDSTNAITGAQHLQVPPGFGNPFNYDNPIDLYSIRWRPTRYEPRDVSVGNGGPDAWIYIDHNGQGAPYAGEGGSVSFRVVPAPPIGVPGLAALSLTMRRRR